MILVSEEEIENESSTPTYAITTKKLFSPDNDLLYSPPNFFYSSLRWRSPTPQRYIQFSDILINKCFSALKPHVLQLYSTHFQC